MHSRRTWSAKEFELPGLKSAWTEIESAILGQLCWCWCGCLFRQERWRQSRFTEQRRVRDAKSPEAKSCDSTLTLERRGPVRFCEPKKLVVFGLEICDSTHGENSGALYCSRLLLAATHKLYGRYSLQMNHMQINASRCNLCYSWDSQHRRVFYGDFYYRILYGCLTRLKLFLHGFLCRPWVRDCNRAAS